MNTTPMNTATAAGSVALVTPVLTYFMSLVQLNPPTQVVSCMVVLLVAGAHWLSNVIVARTNKPV